MPYRYMVISALLATAISMALVGCGKSAPDYSRLPTHTLAFGGDVFLGTRTSQSLYDEASWPTILGDAAPIFKGADIGFVNAEGVIAGGSIPGPKTDRDPLYYRAHPNAVPMLASAGIDVVNIGNNHAGDYGPDAMVEMMDRLRAQGMGYTGGGYDIDDARHPPVYVAGDTGVAIVGVDLTFERGFAAKTGRPGTLFFPLAHIGRDQDATVDGLTQVLEGVRKYANVVFLSPHWGRNWETAPTKHLKRLAERLIDAGYDGILGHSAHLIQGVELIDGKPVIYDAGNLVLSYGGVPDDYNEHQAVAYEIEFNKAGVTRLLAHPIHVGRVATTLAKGKEAAEILGILKERSEAMDTALSIVGETGVITCNPGTLKGPEKPVARPRKPATRIRKAPDYTLLEALPKGATPADVVFENGVRMVGYRLRDTRLSHPRAAAFIETFWTTKRKIDGDILIHMEATGTDQKTGKLHTLFAGHQAGDWILPTSKWPENKIIRDITYFRVGFKAEMPVKFSTGLYAGKFIPVVSSTLPHENGRVYLGEAVQEKGGKGVFDVLSEMTADLKAGR